jgi:phosphatidylserine decarboxylase
MATYTYTDAPGQWTLPVAKAGLPLIFASAFATLVLAILGFTLIALIGLLWTFALVGFFRDPDRAVPAEAGVFVSPADGKVIVAGPVETNPFTSGKALKVSIFMSVFDVHVNRMPCTGRIERVSYHPGKFFAADREIASLQNEHNAVFIATESGATLCVVQVAGLIARRIICRVQTGDRLRRGQRFGMICFGSRLDVYLPTDAQLAVTKGDRVSAGTSIVGRFQGKAAAADQPADHTGPAA